eukprot:jgi/Chlat1/6514/Chrsp45S09068
MWLSCSAHLWPHLYSFTSKHLYTHASLSTEAFHLLLAKLKSQVASNPLHLRLHQRRPIWIQLEFNTNTSTRLDRQLRRRIREGPQSPAEISNVGELVGLEVELSGLAVVANITDAVGLPGVLGLAKDRRNMRPHTMVVLPPDSILLPKVPLPLLLSSIRGLKPPARRHGERDSDGDSRGGGGAVGEG